MPTIYSKNPRPRATLNQFAASVRGEDPQVENTGCGHRHAGLKTSTCIYKPLANCSESTSAFFATAAALSQSLFFIASRAASMNPRTFDARSAWSEFIGLPMAAPKFLSATMRLLFASTLDVTTCSRLNSGTRTGAGFSTRTGSFGGGGATCGLAGALGKGAKCGGNGQSSSAISGGSSISKFAVAVGTIGWASVTGPSWGAAGRRVKHPPLQNTQAHRGTSHSLEAWLRAPFAQSLPISFMPRRRAAVRCGTWCLARPPM